MEIEYMGEMNTMPWDYVPSSEALEEPISRISRRYELTSVLYIILRRAIEKGAYSNQLGYVEWSAKRGYIAYPVTLDRAYHLVSSSIWKLCNLGLLVKVPPSQQTLILTRALKIIRNFKTVKYLGAEIPVKPVSVSDLPFWLLTYLVNNNITPSKLPRGISAKRLIELGLVYKTSPCKYVLTRSGFDNVLGEIERRFEVATNTALKRKSSSYYKLSTKMRVHFCVKWAKRAKKLKVKTVKLEKLADKLHEIVNMVDDTVMIRSFAKYSIWERKTRKSRVEKPVEFTIEI